MTANDSVYDTAAYLGMTRNNNIVGRIL